MAVRAWLAVVLLWMLGGCAQFTPPSDGVRPASYQELSGVEVGGVPLERFLEQRTGIIINGSVSVAEVAANGPALAVRFKAEPNKTLNGPSHAVAIDGRGYFLTAAHCLEAPCTYLVYWDGRRARIVVPRVVAKGADRAHHDFAIVHVDARLPDVFAWPMG